MPDRRVPNSPLKSNNPNQTHIPHCHIDPGVLAMARAHGHQLLGVLVACLLGISRETAGYWHHYRRVRHMVRQQAERKLNKPGLAPNKGRQQGELGSGVHVAVGVEWKHEHEAPQTTANHGQIQSAVA